MDDIAEKINVSEIAYRINTEHPERNSKVILSKKFGTQLHEVFRVFHETWVNSVLQKEEMKIRELEILLRYTSGNTIKQFSYDPALKREARKLLKGFKKQILQLSKRLSVNKRIKTKKLVTEFFGGIPEFEVKLTDETEVNPIGGRCDILARDDYGQITIWEFKTTIPKTQEMKEDIEIQASIYGLLAEGKYGGQCHQLVFSYGSSKIEPVEFSKELRDKARKEIELEKFGLSKKEDRAVVVNKNDIGEGKHTAKVDTNNNCEAEAIPSLLKEYKPNFQVALGKDSSEVIELKHMKADANDHASDSDTFQKVGMIIQNKNNPYKEKSETTAYGYISSDHANKMHVGDLYVIRKDDTRILCEFIEIVSYEEGARIVQNRVNEFVTKVKLKLMYEISGDYKGEVRNQNLDSWDITTPIKEEVFEFLELVTEGIPLGMLKISSTKEIPFIYPKDFLYKSIFVGGVQGTGKTNLIKLLIRALSSRRYVDIDDLPAVVILDVEGEYIRLDSKSRLHEDSQKILESLNIGDQREIDVIQIYSPDIETGEYTLSVREINPKDLASFAPQLTTNSVEIFERYAKEAYRELSNDTRDFTIQKVLEKIEIKADSDPFIHESQKGAIIRACRTNAFHELFDQSDKIPIHPKKLLSPGKITVIDISDLPHDSDQRTVALYFLTMFHNYMLKSRNLDKKLVLIIDEAHRLFPYKSTSELKKEYKDRVSNKVIEITHRGRKRNYGVVFATQSPKDISPDIIDLCNTKIALRIGGPDKWIKEKFGKEFVEEIKNLDIGQAFLSYEGVRLPRRIYMPNISDYNES